MHAPISRKAWKFSEQGNDVTSPLCLRSLTEVERGDWRWTEAPWESDNLNHSYSEK